jgi:hypothetical protein
MKKDRVNLDDIEVKSNKLGRAELREVREEVVHVHNERSANPRFSAATLRVIECLGGDTRTGKCLCPVHDDGSKPSLSVSNGDRTPVLIYCFGKKTRQHNLDIIAYLKRKGAWPSSNKLSGPSASVAAEGQRTAEERWEYAAKIWDPLAEQDDICKDDEGRRISELLLHDYFANRKLKVPRTAVVSLPWSLLPQQDDPTRVIRYPAVVMAIVDRQGRFQGVHTTKLSPDLGHKLVSDDANFPVRQTYGLLKGNFVELQELDYTKPIAKLLIGEGVETTLSAMQLTGLPGIASGGKVNDLKPLAADEYIILVDNDANGGSRSSAGVLAQRLSEHGATVRLATPNKPAGGKDGYDWNDALVDCQAPGMENLLRDEILQAPVFSETMSTDEKYKKDIRELGKLKSRARDEKRTAIKKEFGVRTTTIDEDVKEREREEAEEAEEEAEPGPILEELAQSARTIIESQDVLQLFVDDIARDVAGERNNLKLLYLICTSRLFDRPMSAVLGGPSSGGKSEIREHVLHYFPPEDVISFTLLSERSLLHMERGFEHKILSMGEMVSAEELKIQDYLLRELISSHKLRYPIAVPQKSGPPKTVIIEKDGPVVFLVTSTKAKLNPENETRLVRLEIDESEKQTRRVVKKVARLRCFNLASPDPARFQQWHDAQRWLALGEKRVAVPYAEVLAEMFGSYRSTRLRRDVGQLVTCIQAHALLHREHRERDEDGCLIADIDHDYAAAYQLMSEFMASAAEVRLRKRIHETVKAVRDLTAGPRATYATVRLVANKLEINEEAARRRLKQAEDAGFVFNTEEREKRPSLYQLNRGQPSDPDYDLLPTVKELSKEWELEQRQRNRKSREEKDTESEKKPMTKVAKRESGGKR